MAAQRDDIPKYDKKITRKSNKVGADRGPLDWCRVRVACENCSFSGAFMNRDDSLEDK